MNTEVSTAIVAVIIAVIAFFVTVAQLLQALFGTAEGYRRCQSSVIGPWAKKTKRSFRWSEMRFETIFSTPDIRLQHARQEDNKWIYQLATPLIGTQISRQRTLVPSLESTNEGRGDLVSWLMLLNELHVLQGFQISSRNSQSLAGTSLIDLKHLASCATVTIRTRSWDFMPPDIVRPFASSTVGDIIAIAHRLGMEWKDLRPGESIMRAEGNGQSISSTPVRSLGALLQYTNDRPSASQDPPRWMIANSADADCFGFGIIPGCRALDVQDFPLNTGEPESKVIRNVMVRFGIEDSENYTKDQANVRSFYDFIPLVAAWIPAKGSNIIQIVRPCRKLPSALSWWEGFITFHHRLRDSCSEKTDEQGSPQMHWVLEKFEMLRAKYPWNKIPSWEDESGNNKVGNGRDREYLKDLYSIWSECTHSLGPYVSDRSCDYEDLVAGHIAMAVTCPAEAIKTVGNGTDKNARWWNGAVRSHHMAETMHLYIDRIPKVADFMAGRGFEDRGAVKDAWYTMILRAMCWQRSVFFIDRELAPSGLYDSKVPVYIA